MYADFYHKKEKTIDISFPKLLIVMITILLFFVFPAQIITAYKTQPDLFDDAVAKFTQNLPFLNSEEEGQVAGASTSGMISPVNASSGDSTETGSNDSSMFAVLGVFFLGVSVIAIWYLKQTEKDYKIIR